MSKIVKVDEYGFMMLSDFASLIPIHKVKYYSIKYNKDKTLTLKFYDGKKKVVKPYVK